MCRIDDVMNRPFAAMKTLSAAVECGWVQDTAGITSYTQIGWIQV